MYRDKTLYMLKLVKQQHNTNIIKDFFAQLARMDELDIFPIVNAISSNKTSLEDLIVECIQTQPWMTSISLKDIRNVVVFILWRDFKIMCSPNESYVPSEYEHMDTKSNGYTDNLINLLESCFYVMQILCIKNENIPEMWDRFVPWIHLHYKERGLKETVRFLTSLITPLCKKF